MFYFADAPTLLVDLFTLNAHPIAYTTVAILTATTFFFGGFAREQICIYACPWPRIQAAMMDEDTLTVAYREWRGEPRGKGNVRRVSAQKAREAEAQTHAAGAGEAKYGPTPYPGMPGRRGGPARADGPGDCIDCMACVNVCPVGIDIRDGQQMECITCALCIDACDEVMEKIGKPRGLIDYMALTDEVNERAGQPPKPVWKHVFRPRTVLYTTLWALVGIGLVVALFIRSDMDMTVAPVRNPTYVTLADGSVRNTYEVRLRNMHGDERRFNLSVKGDPAIRIQLEGTPYSSISVPADEMFLQRVYLVAPPGSDPRSPTAPMCGSGSRTRRTASAPTRTRSSTERAADGTARDHRQTCADRLCRGVRRDHRGQPAAGLFRDPHLSGAGGGQFLCREPGIRRRKAAQEALGWTVSVDHTGGLLILRITDAKGIPVAVADLDATVGRATHVQDDQTPDFRFDGNAYVAPVPLGDGNWNIRMTARAQDGTLFEQRIEFQKD